MRKICILIKIILLSNLLCAQESQHTVDSLSQVLQRLSDNSHEIKLAKGSDTMKVIVLNRLGRHYRSINNYELSLKYFTDALENAKTAGYKKGEAAALNNLAIVNERRGAYDTALININDALKIREELNDKRGIASCYHSMGVIYVKQGNYEKAMVFYLRALKLLEELGEKKAVATSYNNIANIFFKQSNYEKALANYNNALKIQLELDDKEGLSLVYGNLGSIYHKLGKYDEALNADFKCLKICEELGDNEGIGFCYNSIGCVYEIRKEYSKALMYQFKSLEIIEKTGNKELIAVTSLSIGNLYKAQEKWDSSLVYISKAKEIFKSIGNRGGLKDAYKSMAELYQGLGEFKTALEYHKLYSALKDTLLNESSGKQITEMNTKYESEKKEKDIELLTKDKKLQATEISRQKLIRNGFLFGLILAIILSYIIFSRFQLTRKQKKIIEFQNAQIVESINYSKKIQDALLPSLESMQNVLPSLFVFYEPKDVVSGDFYFFKEFNNYILLACVDCTGHGVPGGFMSTLGSLLLDKIANDESLKPSEILTKLNDEIIRVLHQQSGGELQDGMDLSVCLIDRQNRKIEFSGARNGIIVVTNGEAKRYKASPLPVGGNYMKKGIPVERNFQTQTISLNTNDWVYMYTDGFIEQIGGPDNAPMNYVQFEKQLIALSSTNEVAGKINVLKNALRDWKGNSERNDDILIIGFSLEPF
jgi:tetratricopeptide (TPR) repeat protein/serine phosphatase RsbU (regulator of sigma subunit)